MDAPALILLALLVGGLLLNLTWPVLVGSRRRPR